MAQPTARQLLEMLLLGWSDQVYECVQAMHGRAALTTFDDSGGAEVDIEVLTQDITRLFRKCEGRLQQFGAGVPTSEADKKVGDCTSCTAALDRM